MARRPSQHRPVIEAIDGLGDDAFSGWEVARRTGVPRASVTRVMGVLSEMGLLTYDGSGGHIPWRKSMSWVPELVVEQYECWLRARSVAKRSVDKRPRVAV